MKGDWRKSGRITFCSSITTRPFCNLSQKGGIGKDNDLV